MKFKTVDEIIQLIIDQFNTIEATQTQNKQKTEMCVMNHSGLSSVTVADLRAKNELAANLFKKVGHYANNLLLRLAETKPTTHLQLGNILSEFLGQTLLGWVAPTTKRLVCEAILNGVEIQLVGNDYDAFGDPEITLLMQKMPEYKDILKFKPKAAKLIVDEMAEKLPDNEHSLQELLYKADGRKYAVGDEERYNRVETSIKAATEELVITHVPGL